MYQNIRTLILICISINLFANNNIDQYIRSGDSVDLTKGTKVTNMPYGYFIGQFGKSSIKGYDKIDLSDYENKKLLVGYGVYDIKDENCRYLDIPSNSTFDIAFEHRFVLNNSTYGLSRDKMTYSQCVSKVAQYNGFVFTPKDISEFGATVRHFGQNKEMWIGYTRKDCNSNYFNDENFEQTYENFQYPIEECSDINNFTYSPTNSNQWLRTNQNNEYYCPIKINSPDYRRPIKFCMPWWRVERQWKLDKNNDIFEFNGEKYDLRYMQYIIDYPKDEVICSAINTSSSDLDSQINKKFNITCNSYDSIKESPTCIDDISQPICHVNECKGYIENTCVKQDTFPPFKDYSVGYIFIDNIETKVKIKENIQIHSYICPQPPKSQEQCLVKEEVTVFPEHCPGSKCDELSNCLQDKTNTFENCISSYPCEKNYGTVDNIIRDANGIAIALGGVCQDGSTVEAKIEFKSRTKKTCLEYDELTQSTEDYKTCISKATSSNKTVSTSITANDEYSLDDRCIRTNNIGESRPSVQTVFSYITKGFFKTTIQKAYIDGSENNNDINSTTEYMLNVSNSAIKVIDNGSQEVTSNNNDTYETDKTFCESTFSDDWIEKRYFNLGDSGNLTTLLGYLIKNNTEEDIQCPDNETIENGYCKDDVIITQSDSNTDIYSCEKAEYFVNETNTSCYGPLWYNLPIIGISTDKLNCDNIATNSGLSTNTNGYVKWTNYNFNSLGITQEHIENKDYCIVGGNKFIQNDNIFKTIKKTTNGILYTSNNSIKKSLCESYSKCLPSGVKTVYFNDTELKECIIEASEDYGDDPTAALSDIPDYTNSTIVEVEDIEGTFTGEINGYSDLFAVQEYTEGDFGYISNYMFKLPKNNIVKIDEREISPIIEHSPIEYSIQYEFDMLNHTQKTRNQSPTNRSSEVSGFFSKTSESIGDGVTGDPLLDTTFRILNAPIALLFGKRQNWGWYESSYKLYQDLNIDTKFVPNIYGYDPRILEDEKLMWDRQTIKTGTQKEGDYLRATKIIVNQKKDKFTNMGFSDDVLNTKLTNATEKGALTMGFPGAKKKWGIERLYYTTNRESTSSGYYDDVMKNINTLYMGAVNSLSIVVPYKGEYEIKAYDKNNNLLATKIIEEQNFISNISSTSGNVAQTFAKVQLATSTNFNIAPGENNNLTNGGCIASNFVEWGGGVSGAYFERGVPDIGLGSDCFKSNDGYVKSHSATIITVRAVNSKVVFVIKLKKPMPYPNRIVLVNLMQLENRKYECWTELNKCSINNDTNQTE